MSFDPISAGIDLVKTFANKFISDKMSESEKKNLEMQAEIFVASEARNEESTFRSFVVEYEGAARDVPKIIVIFRSLIRPAFTCLTGYLDFIFFTGNVAAWTPEAVGLLKAINAIVLIFWFGEKAVARSGILEYLGKKK